MSPLLYTVFLVLPLLTSLLFLHSHLISPLPFLVFTLFLSYFLSFPFHSSYTFSFTLLPFPAFSSCPPQFFSHLFFFPFPFRSSCFPFSSVLFCLPLLLFLLSSALFTFPSSPQLSSPPRLLSHCSFPFLACSYFSRSPLLSLSAHIFFSCCLPQFNFLFFSFLHFLICPSYLFSPLPF